MYHTDVLVYYTVVRNVTFREMVSIIHANEQGYLCNSWTSC